MTRSHIPLDLPKNHQQTIEWWARVLDAAEKRDVADPVENDRSFWHRQARRWLCRNDLFYLLTVECERKDINHPWLHDRCREVQADPNGYLDLWAREHYKSTIITFGLSIQDILASHGDDPEPRYGGREITIGIFSHTNAIATDFMRQIKREFETNARLKELFPDVLYTNPEYQAPSWSLQGGITVKRKSNPKEATVEASGLVDGMPTGKHYFLMVFDDVVTKESVATPDQIKKTTAAWELADNLGTEGGWRRHIGTRYALFDTYSVMMDRGMPTRTYPCTSDGSEDWSKAVLKSPEELQRKRTTQGLYTFGAQMLLNPMADRSMGFSPEWLRYWPAESADNLNTYILVDPAGEKKKENDFTSMWVVGAGGDKGLYVLDGIYDKLNLVERQRALFDLHRRWRPRGVAYEKYGKDADIEHMEAMMTAQNYRFVITAVAGSMPKNDRIRRLVPYFEQGRIYLPQYGIVRTNYEGRAVNIVDEFIEREYRAFPVVTHDDQLDCLSRICDLDIIYPDPDYSTAHEMPEWMKEAIEDEQFGDDDSFMTA